MPRKKFSIEKRETRDAWIMMFPSILILSMIAVFPVLRTFWLSLHEMVLTDPGSGFPFVGLRNYASLLQDTRSWDAVFFTFRFTTVTVSLELIFGFAAALLMNQTFRGRGFVRAAILVPWAIPTSVSAMMWTFIFNDQFGMFNDVLFRLRIIDQYRAWLATPQDTFMALVITDVWKTTPFVALIILAGLQLIPQQLYEAAKIDGANAFQRFFHVTLPNIRSTVLVALLFRSMEAFRVFDLVAVMTGGAHRTESVALYAYNIKMRFLDFGYGSAMAVFIFMIIFIMSLIYMRFLGDSIIRQ